MTELEAVVTSLKTAVDGGSLNVGAPVMGLTATYQITAPA